LSSAGAPCATPPSSRCSSACACSCARRSRDSQEMDRALDRADLGPVRPPAGQPGRSRRAAPRHRPAFKPQRKGAVPCQRRNRRRADRRLGSGAP
jgi:hypothetical protein